VLQLEVQVAGLEASLQQCRLELEKVRGQYFDLLEGPLGAGAG
jgi:hypothetical protein